MRFIAVETSYVDHTIREEGTEFEWHPPRCTEGKPLVRISGNLRPIDDEAKAYAEEAAAYFASIRDSGATDTVDGAAVQARVDEMLGPLVNAFKGVKFTAS